MILRKEFYFVRHGQTNHNLLEGLHKGDHLGDTPLNETGRAQAHTIAPLVAQLPIQTICVSPMKRAQETKEIITTRLQALHCIIDELGECTMQIWKEMVERGMYASPPLEGPARHFMDRVQQGINQALSLPAPSLIVAHGGVHWATCCLMGIQEHDWNIPNCAVIHFCVDRGKWVAKTLT